MAKGFAAGVIQGTVICGAALVALSLALPPPPRPVSPDAVSVDAAPRVTTPVDTPTTPAAESLSVPAGSEFARGADMRPRAPEPLSQAPRIADVPTVARPADEPAPEAAETERLRPDARGEAPTAPVVALPEAAPVDLPAPAGEAPIPVPPPGRVVVPALDRAPEQAISEPDDPAGQPAPQAPALQIAPADSPALPGMTAVLPEIASEAAPEARPGAESGPSAFVDTPIPVDALAPDLASPAPIPALAPATGPDLSLPPDFGALRLND